MTLEVNLGTFWKKALATFLTATANDVTAGLSRHTGAEAVLTLAGTLGWLVSSFAHGEKPGYRLSPFPEAEGRAGNLDIPTQLSTRHSHIHAFFLFHRQFSIAEDTISTYSFLHQPWILKHQIIT